MKLKFRMLNFPNRDKKTNKLETKQLSSNLNSLERRISRNRGHHHIEEKDREAVLVRLHSKELVLTSEKLRQGCMALLFFGHIISNVIIIIIIISPVNIELQSN